MIRLAHWEKTELIEHLMSRTDIWSRSDENPNLWLRTYVREWVAEERVEDPACGLLFGEQDGHIMVSIFPISWDAEQCELYLKRLLTHWTGYGHRQRVIAFFINTLDLSPEAAELSSIVLEGLSEDGPELKRVADPEDTPEQISLYPDSLPPLYPAPEDPSDLGTWLLAGSSGWVNMRLLGGMIKITASIRMRDSGGFGPLAEGWIRPVDGRTRDYAAALRGWPDEPKKPKAVPGKSSLEDVIMCLQKDEFCAGEVLVESGLCVAHSGLLNRDPVEVVQREASPDKEPSLDEQIALMEQLLKEKLGG